MASDGWYVLHVFSGHEGRIEKRIRGMVEEGLLSQWVVDVRVPSDEVVETRGGKKRVTTKRFLTGYILLRLRITPQEWRNVSGALRKIHGVVGFVGRSSTALPSSVPPEEIKHVLQRPKGAKAGGGSGYESRKEFTVGEEVCVTGGPFESFSGTVDSVNEEKSRLRVMVRIFGRITPVDVDFSQAERV